jgi:hypothetical protein
MRVSEKEFFFFKELALSNTPVSPLLHHWLHRPGMTRWITDLAGTFLCLPPGQLTNLANAMTQ